MAHNDRTTFKNGNTAPRKTRGFFMSGFFAEGHQPKGKESEHASFQNWRKVYTGELRRLAARTTGAIS